MIALAADRMRAVRIAAFAALSAAVVLVLMTVPTSAQGPAREKAEETIAGFAPEEAYRLGQRMYREGILPSGEPMRATVEDMPMDGTMLSCVSCHLRSGVGSLEGTVITLPTNAGWLYEPMLGARMTDTARDRLPSHLRREQFRPPYTDSTLARALRAGRDPNGRILHPAMPRYQLDAADMEVLVFYLKHLSADISPGVTETTIRFATVVTEGIEPEIRQAFLDTLQAHIDTHNSQSRHQERRARQGPFYKEEKFTAYRRLDLSVWELKGPEQTWKAQLESYLSQEPVFALLSGIGSGDWRPIHEFCEEHQLPNVFPITDFPVVSESDFYTLYFSKGWYQEGETAAKYLRSESDTPGALKAIEVRRDDPAARALSRGFGQTRELLHEAPAQSRILDNDEQLDDEQWRELAREAAGEDLVLWLGADDLGAISALADVSPGPRLVIASAKLLGEGFSSLPENLRSRIYFTYPYTLPGEKQQATVATQQWLRSRGVAMTDETMQSKIYFVGWMLAGVLQRMRHDFYRDYFLDVVDMMRDQYYTIAPYWRLSFGPGQRFAAKGCYVLQLSEGPDPHWVKKSGWVVH